MFTADFWAWTLILLPFAVYMVTMLILGVLDMRCGAAPLQVSRLAAFLYVLLVLAITAMSSILGVRASGDPHTLDHSVGIISGFMSLTALVILLIQEPYMLDKD